MSRTAFVIPCRDAVWSPDGNLLGTTKDSHTSRELDVLVYNTSTMIPKTLGRVPLSTRRILSWSPNGRYLIVVSSPQSHVDIFDIAENDVIRPDPNVRLSEDPSHKRTNGVCVTWSPCSTKIALHMYHDYKNLCPTVIFELEDGVGMHRKCELKTYRASLAWSPNGREIAHMSIGTGGLHIDIVDSGNGSHIRSLYGPNYERINSQIGLSYTIEKIFWTANHHIIGHIQNGLVVWSTDTWEPFKEYMTGQAEPSNKIMCLSYSKADGGKLAISTRHDDTIVVNELMEELYRIEPDPDESVTSSKWSADGRYLMECVNQTVRVRKCTKTDSKTVYYGPHDDTDMSPCGKQVLFTNRKTGSDKNIENHGIECITLCKYSDRDHRLFSLPFRRIVFHLMCIQSRLIAAGKRNLSMCMWLDVFDELQKVYDIIGTGANWDYKNNRMDESCHLNYYFFKEENEMLCDS